MKRLLLAPLFLTLLLSSCKGQQIGEEKYVSELDLAVEQMELITNMVEDYKQRGIMLKNQYSPISAKAMIQRSIDLIYKAKEKSIPYEEFMKFFNQLEENLLKNDFKSSYLILEKLVPEWQKIN